MCIPIVCLHRFICPNGQLPHYNIEQLFPMNNCYNVPMNNFYIDNISFSTWINIQMNNRNTLPNAYTLLQLIEGYGDFLHTQMADVLHGYLLTIMFSPIQGSDQIRKLEMTKYLGWFYGRLAKASVPKPSHPKWSHLLPKLILAPDRPVPKHSKAQLRDVTINHGIHYHGLALINPSAPKLQEPLDVHIKNNPDKYLVRGIREIDVKPITHDPEYVAEYALKSIESRFSSDEIVIFPRSVSELPPKSLRGSEGPVLAPPDRPTYDFQRK
jgi:hypothetical protein